MKKLFNSPRFIFTALEVCSVIAMLPAVEIFAEVAQDGLLRAPFAAYMMFPMLAEAVLWIVMWVSFLLMCRRLKDEPSAFTERNARTLLIIAVCCGAIGLLLIGENDAGIMLATLSRYRSRLMGGLPLAVFFFGVTTVALVLRWLLKGAMALQQDSDLTI